MIKYTMHTPAPETLTVSDSASAKNAIRDACDALYQHTEKEFIDQLNVIATEIADEEPLLAPKEVASRATAEMKTSLTQVAVDAGRSRDNHAATAFNAIIAECALKFMLHLDMITNKVAEHVDAHRAAQDAEREDV